MRRWMAKQSQINRPAHLNVRPTTGATNGAVPERSMMLIDTGARVEGGIHGGNVTELFGG